MIKSLFLSSVMATSAVAVALGGKGHDQFACGAPEPSMEQLKVHKSMAHAEAIAHPIMAKATINVNTYVHVVSTSRKESDGYLSDATIAAQMKVLNDDYAPSGISFTFKGVDRTVNADWATDGDEYAMKKALRKGTYKDLNLYYMTDLGKNLGYCHFPTNVRTGDSNFIVDGCNIVASSTPGNPGQYGLGKTSTHEVGHWFGLLHTFQGGCTGSGDGVDDTPAQASFSRGCPVGRDSCPDQPGLDPIHNYMDYSSDSCYEEFTAGQMTRMKSMWNKYRA